MAGLWEALIPNTVDVTNLITNPSFELNVNGYADSGGGTFVQDATNQRRGVYSGKWTPASNNDLVAYTTGLSLTSGASYYFSLDVLAPLNTALYVSFATTGNVAVGSAATFLGTGYWQRAAVSYSAASTATWRVLISQNNSANRAAIWLDGWMAQTNSLNQSYIDGDQAGCYWLNAPEASTSIGTAFNRNVGVWTNLDAYNISVRGWTGGGMPPVAGVLLPYALPPGSYYQRSRAMARALALSVTHRGTTLATLLRAREQLMDWFKPDSTPAFAGAWLRFGSDPSAGIPRPQLVQAVYDSGDEINYVAPSDGTLGFRTDDDVKLILPNPFPQDEGNIAFAFSAVSVASAGNANSVAFAPNRQQWNNIGTGEANGGWCCLFNPYDGRFYVGHHGLIFNGVANTGGIFAFDPSTQTVSALGTGASVNSGGAGVRALALAPNGDVIAGGGNIFNFGGVANTQNIGRWSLSSGSWQSIATTGTGNLTDFIASLVVFADNTIFAAGSFTTISGASGYSNIAQRNSAGTWSNLTGGGINGPGYGMAVGLDQATLYVVGQFVTAGAASVNSIGIYNRTTASWSGIGTGVNGGGSAVAVAIAPNGTVYFGGQITSINGVTVNGVGSYNGIQISPLSTGLSTVDAANRVVWLFVDANTNILHVSGIWAATTKIGGLLVPNSYALWNGSAFIPTDVSLPASSTINGYASDPAGNRMIAGVFSGATLTSASFAVINNPATLGCYPTFQFTGPGTLYQLRNATTLETIGFTNLTLATSEVATLVLSPLGTQFYSNFRSNLLGNIAPGSNQPPLHLLPGSVAAAAPNVLELLMTGASTTTRATLQWTRQNWGLEGGSF